MSTANVYVYFSSSSSLFPRFFGPSLQSSLAGWSA